MPANRIQNAVERHRAQLAVEFERDRRSPLFEHSPDPIVEVEYDENDARVTAINRAFEKTFDIDEEEVLGEDVVESVEAKVASDQDRADLESMKELVRDGQSVSREVIRTVDGSRQEFLLRIFPFELGENTRRAYGWYIDLSERKAAERRFREIFERSNEAMLVIDPHREKIVAANPAAAELLGYDRSELLEQAPQDIHPHEIDRFRAFLDSVDRTG
ncbi:MAG: PAS domain S-box protein, partial [Halobacteriales archaeon]